MKNDNFKLLVTVKGFDTWTEYPFDSLQELYDYETELFSYSAYITKILRWDGYSYVTLRAQNNSHLKLVK